MNVIATIIKGLLLTVIILFAAFNTQNTEIVVVPGYLKYNMPLFLPLLIAFLAGGALATIIYLTEKFAKSQEIKSYKKHIAALESELAQLRNIPFTTDPNPSSNEQH